MTKTYRIAAIPGDGIGKEVMPEGVRVLDAAARKFGFTIAFDHFDWNCERQVKSGHWMPDNWKEQAGGHDASTLAQHEGEHVGRPRAEGNAHADLPGPLRHRVRNHAVDSDRGERHRQARQAGEQQHG